MASLPNPNRVTYEEWLEMPVVEDATEEVVNGEIRIMPANKLKHARIVNKVENAFKAQVDQEQVLVLAAECGLIIRKTPLTSRVPDFAAYLESTLVERDGYIHSAPQLVAEVRSPRNTARERAEKLSDYASIGVPEVWDVIPDSRAVEVLLLEDGRYRRAAILSEGLLIPICFPNVKIDIARIWPD